MYGHGGSGELRAQVQGENVALYSHMPFVFQLLA